MNEAENAGWKAAESGLCAVDCPFRDDLPDGEWLKHQAWMRGYYQRLDHMRMDARTW